LLRVLAGVGTAAMLWVGGGILVHGLAELGWGVVAAWQHGAAHHVELALGGGGFGGALGWVAGAALAGVAGLVVGSCVVGAQHGWRILVR
jgi:predicted DNA repair protein MutK